MSDQNQTRQKDNGKLVIKLVAIVFCMFGFGTPGELASQGGASESSSGVPQPKQKKQLEYVCFSNLH